MSRPDEPSPDEGEKSVYREYVLDVRIVEVPRPGEETRHRFEAPEHTSVEFEDPETAELYADVYFDVNGFQEAGTGERGVPPVVIQAGRDTLATYLLTQPGTDINWVASFYGVKTSKIKRYVAAVRNRAEEIRSGVKDAGVAS
jgi:hypothetical protein